MIEKLHKLRQHLLTGVSYAIPFIACGGIMIAAAIGLATYHYHGHMPMTSNGPDFSQLPKLKLILDIGVASFSLMLSVLAGYIAYSIAGILLFRIPRSAQVSWAPCWQDCWLDTLLRASRKSPSLITYGLSCRF